jgi:hypothetical protein
LFGIVPLSWWYVRPAHSTISAKRADRGEAEEWGSGGETAFLFGASIS